MNKIRQGDEVMVLAGRNKGSRGRVKRVILDLYGKPEQVVVEGVNMLTHFVRPNPQKNDPGGRIEKEAAMPVAKVAVLDPDSGQPARIKIVTGEDGKKIRRFYVSRPRQAATTGAAQKAEEEQSNE